MTDIEKIDYRITLNETNILKGIAICAMLCHHLFFENPEYGTIAFKLALTGKVCVALFVFLSGYGMAVKYQKHLSDNQGAQRGKCWTLLRGFWDKLLFLLRRYMKFYMNYWAVFCLTVPIGVLVFGRTLADAYGVESSLWSSLFSDIFGLKVFESYNITWWVNRLFLALWLFFPFLYWSMNSKLVSIWMLILLYCNPGSILYPLKFVAPGLSAWIISFTIGIFLAINGFMLNIILNKFNRYFVMIMLWTLALAFLYMRNNYVFSCFLGTSGDPFIVMFLSLAVVSFCRLTHRKIAILAFVGKHSMNMYLMHTFVFSYFFHDFIYSFKYPILIFSMLFLISLLLSIVVEFFKKELGFYRLQNLAIHALKIQKKPLV